MAVRRRDRWRLVDAYSLPEAARGGPEVDLPRPDDVLAWVQFPNRILEVEGRVLAYTERAVLVEWGRGQGADCAWVWRDAVRPRTRGSGVGPTAVE
ncbi:hypothetical protein [Curtobacterium sp. UCD-KPL2560]|uniref:hypothetical protein n=1 Tax=Curtobacterium sp. UCD-KPL2560 TaxID=1885315 RepID=UPI00114D0F6E|nr:hypothetical protein [Curtobacterium sp. UCD-KPL2560]